MDITLPKLQKTVKDKGAWMVSRKVEASPDDNEKINWLIDRHFSGVKKMIMSPTRSGFPNLFELRAVSATGRCVVLETQGESRKNKTIHLCTKRGCRRNSKANVHTSKV